MKGIFMKTKVFVLIFLVGAIVLFSGYEQSLAARKSKASLSEVKIGVVSVTQIFKDCKRNVKYREETKAEYEKLAGELKKLEADIEADKAGLVTLKAGSSDHTEQVKEILVKQSTLQTHQKFYERQLELKEQRWTEELYQDILKATEEVAKEKGLTLVLENSRVELPALSAQDLMMTIRTNKVLYGDGSVDITDEVLEKVDSKK